MSTPLFYQHIIVYKTGKSNRSVGSKPFTAGLYPKIYNTSDDIRALAAGLIRVSAICMPIYAYTNALYFTLRSGGRTGITFLFDSGYSWVILIPYAYFLSHFTSIGALQMYLMVQLMDIVKCILGYFMVRSGTWAQNLTVQE